MKKYFTKTNVTLMSCIAIFVIAIVLVIFIDSDRKVVEENSTYESLTDISYESESKNLEVKEISSEESETKETTTEKVEYTKSEVSETTTVKTVPVTEPVREIRSDGYFNVPLSEDLQDHIFSLCDTYGIDPAIVVAIIEKESNYNHNCVGDNGNSLGLMQIQPRWSYDRMNYLGCSNLLDPYQNVNVGIDLLADLYSTGNSTEWVLMAYNGGTSYANRKISQGSVSDYAYTVINTSYRLKESAA